MKQNRLNCEGFPCTCHEGMWEKLRYISNIFNHITLAPAMLQTLNCPAGSLIPVLTTLSWLLLVVRSSSIPTSLANSHTVTHHSSLIHLLICSMFIQFDTYFLSTQLCWLMVLHFQLGKTNQMSQCYSSFTLQNKIFLIFMQQFCCIEAKLYAHALYFFNMLFSNEVSFTESKTPNPASQKVLPK